MALPPLQLGTFPSSKARTGIVGRIQERLEALRGGAPRSGGLIRENENGHVGAVERFAREDRSRLEAGRLRSRVGKEGGLLHRAAPQPEPVADHFVGVGLARDRIGPGTLGGLPAREPRHRKIEASPEKMDRTALTDERATKVVEHGLDGKRSEEHTSELQSQSNLVCRLLLEKKNKKKKQR